MEKTKLTKKEIFTNLLEEEVIQNNPEYKELIEKQIANLSSSSKSTMNVEEVKAVLSIVPKPIAEIANAANLTERQTVSRLSKLVSQGIAAKENVTIEGRKLAAYRLKEEN